MKMMNKRSIRGSATILLVMATVGSGTAAQAALGNRFARHTATGGEIARNKATVRRFYEEVFNKGNLSAIDALTVPGFVEHSMMPGQKPGMDAFKQSIRDFRSAFPDMHFTIDDMIASGDKVVARWTMRGTNRGRFMGVAPTGRKVTMRGVDIVRLRRGRAVEHWGYEDDLGLMQQLQSK